MTNGHSFDRFSSKRGENPILDKHVLAEPIRVNHFLMIFFVLTPAPVVLLTVSGRRGFRLLIGGETRLYNNAFF